MFNMYRTRNADVMVEHSVNNIIYSIQNFLPNYRFSSNVDVCILEIIMCEIYI